MFMHVEHLAKYIYVFLEEVKMKKLILLLMIAGLTINAHAVIVSAYDFETGYAPTVGTAVGVASGGATISSAYNGVTVGVDHELGDVLDVTAGSAMVTVGNADIGSINSAITVGAWVLNDGTNWTKAIVSRGYSWQLFGGSNRATFQVADTVPTGSKIEASNTFDNEWHHIAGVYDGTQYTLYIDGVQDGPSIIASGPITAWGDPLTFGTRATRYFDGWIDDVRIFDDAQTQAQIQEWAGVPEPMTIALLGLGGLLIRRRR